MTAHFLPPVARQAKPARVPFEHPDVTAADLAAVPGRKGLPIVGILPEAVFDPLAFARRMYERYGPVHRFYACGNWNVQMVGPEANAFVLFDQAGNFSAEGGWKPVFGRHFAGGLLLRDGADHQWHRKLVATAFKQDHLQAYLRVFGRNNRELVGRWSGRTLGLYELAQGLTFANGYAAFLGRDPELASRKDLLAFRHLMQSATAVVTLPLPGTAESRALAARLHVRRLIDRLLAEEVSPARTDLLALLWRMLRDGLLDEEEVRAHLTFVIAASFDTLSSGTVAALYHLAANPVWQERVREELCSSIGDPFEISLTDLGRCEISERAVKEALRLNSGAPVLWRRSIREFSFGGYRFPAGTITGVNPMLTHLLPEIWDAPDRFDPDRFAPEPSRLRHRAAFLPFGGGAHGCLGANYASLQVRALLRALLAEHALVLPAGERPHWYHWPNCQPRGRLRLELRKL